MTVSPVSLSARQTRGGGGGGRGVASQTWDSPLPTLGLWWHVPLQCLNSSPACRVSEDRSSWRQLCSSKAWPLVPVLPPLSGLSSSSSSVIPPGSSWSLCGQHPVGPAQATRRELRPRQSQRWELGDAGGGARVQAGALPTRRRRGHVSPWFTPRCLGSQAWPLPGGGGGVSAGN